jgi:cytochrome b
MTRASAASILVWDLPVRIVHWLLVALLAFQVVSAWHGGEWMRWHAASGYTILFLIAFRVCWGFVGTRHARFSSFLAGPAAVVRMLPAMFRRKPLEFAGHNPLAGWMVVVLLAALLLQVGTGLFGNDGAGFEGPLATRVTAETSAAITAFHRFNARIVLGLSALHVAAALWHLAFKRDNLIAAMVTGRKALAFDAPETGTVRAAPLLLSLALALLLVYVVLGTAL